MLENKNRSVLVYFFAIAVVMILTIIVLSSISLKKQLTAYFRATAAEKSLQTCSTIYQAVQNYGFERGRVNVVMNFQGPMQKMQKSIDFLTQHGTDGDAHLEIALMDGREFGHDNYQHLLQEIEKTHEQIETLRQRYHYEFKQSFSRRDLSLDDLWFGAMSKQIEQLNYLLFSIIQSEKWLPEQRNLAEAFYILSQLRDNAGPVVSYLKAASFNLASLSPDRVSEIRNRRMATEEYLNKIIMIGKSNLSETTQRSIMEFKREYMGSFLSQAETFIKHFNNAETPPLLATDYLPQGVKLLQQLNAISQELVQSYTAISQKAIENEKNNLLISLSAYIVLFVMVLAVLFFAHKQVYRRIIFNSKILENLIQGKLDTEIPAPVYFDEIDQIQSGLQRFRENLVRLNRANSLLQTETEQRRRSEEELKKLSDERGLLLREIHHRVKNNLQVISSMISLQSRRQQDPDSIMALMEAQRRITHIATAHKSLYQSENLAVVQTEPFFRSIIEQTVNICFERDDIVLDVHIDDFELDFEQATTSAQIIGELVSNCFKHAFPSQTEGEIGIRITLTGEEVRFCVTDNGVGFDYQQGQNKSLGLMLIEGFVKKLQGDLSYGFEKGTQVTITFKKNE